MRKNTLLRKLLPLIVVVAAILLTAGVVGLTMNKKEDRPRETTEEPEDVVEIHGVKCRPKKNLKSWLFIGLDASDEQSQLGNGQCDVLQLIVYDQVHKTYSVLAINRDTMADVDLLDEEGYYISTDRLQIAFAHSDGDGKERSCENVVNAVSRLLYDQKIDGYAALNMDAIGTLNHLVGGVTVTVKDDFSREDPSLRMGETVKLTDEQAVHFVRGRMSVGDGTNENRMKRQSQFMAAFKPMLLEKCKADNAYALDVYDALEPYMVTDLSRNDFINISGFLMESEEKTAPVIEGTNAIGEMEFNEFTVDEDSLADAVIELFYNRVE